MAQPIIIDITWTDVIKILLILIPSLISIHYALFKFLDKRSKTFETSMNSVVNSFSVLVNNHMSTYTQALTESIEKFSDLHHREQLQHQRQLDLLEILIDRINNKR